MSPRKRWPHPKKVLSDLGQRARVVAARWALETKPPSLAITLAIGRTVGERAPEDHLSKPAPGEVPFGADLFYTNWV